MITINLVPEEKRRRRHRGGLLPVGFVLPREVIFGLIGGFFVLLVLWHVLLQGMIVVKYIQLKGQQSRWQKVLPEKKMIDDVIKDLRERQARVKTIESVKADNNISWSKKMQAISTSLPQGIWLGRVRFENGELLINGSSVSKHKVEMITVHSFVKQLKESPDFMEGVVAVELESIKSRRVGEISVADFVVRAMLNVVEDKSKNVVDPKSKKAKK
jgi:Tfp pilus assembly protein PilN